MRTDLLPPAYVRALTSLQEDVPAFSTAEARAIIEDELGPAGAARLLPGLSAEPVAAASLGQVCVCVRPCVCVWIRRVCKLDRPTARAPRVALDAAGSTARVASSRAVFLVVVCV